MDSELTPERRMVVALLLSFAIYLGWGYYTLDKRKHAAPPTPAAEMVATASKDVPQAGSVGGSAAVPTGMPNAAPGTAVAAAAAPEQIIDLSTPEMHLSLTSWGGTLVHAQLQAPKYQRDVAGKEEAIDLARTTTEGRHPLETKFGGALAAMPSTAPYEVAKDPDGRGVRFTRQEGGATIEKHFFVVAPYLAELDVSVKGAAPDHIDLSFPGDQPPGSSASSSFLGFGRSVANVATGVCLVDGSSERGQGGRPGEIKPESKSFPKDGKAGQVAFAGLDERFFVGAVYPAEADRAGHCTVASLATGSVDAMLELPLATDQVRRFGVYLGPKDFDRLRKSSVLPGETSPSASLDGAIDFGFWTALCVPMLVAMEFFHNRLAHNWGIAIILLTVVIKLLMLPLQDRSYRSMEKMKRLAPEVEALKKKLGEDKEALNRETMKLYSERGVNPLGSCLPMLIQMPIWFALYRLLGNTIQLYREPFIAGWINDLTAADPFYVLPIGMGATMVVTQFLTPQPVQGGQQKVLMWFMPIFFTVTFLKVPAGLSLYIFASNLLNIVQQYWITRRFKAAAPAAS